MNLCHVASLVMKEACARSVRVWGIPSLQKCQNPKRKSVIRSHLLLIGRVTHLQEMMFSYLLG